MFDAALTPKPCLQLPDVVGKGYAAFWRFQGRYRVVKGGRASKKSKTTALNIITRMMHTNGANTLVVRKVYRTLKDSCFAELKWAVSRLRCQRYWTFKESPLEMTYRPTGQKIFFRGLDDPLKITSLAPEKGVLCWMWIEEAFEIADERDFNVLDECLRGGGTLPGARVQNGLIYKQITLTFNPWNERHWLKSRFFDKKCRDVFTMTADYRRNEFLDADDRKFFADLKKRDPRRYQIAGLGRWGAADNLIYSAWREESFDWRDPSFQKNHPALRTVFGLDFGYTSDPSALFCAAVDPLTPGKPTLYVFDELYEKRLTNRLLFERIEAMGFRKERIRADAAEPKSIEELRELGLQNIRAARKGPDSIRNGIQLIQDYSIVIHPRCVNFLTEISCYAWDPDSPGRPGPGPDHLMDAMRYAMEDTAAGALFSF